jgi:hypothetical protein
MNSSHQTLYNNDQRKIEKKLREINKLKNKSNLTKEELAKVKKEDQYKRSLNKIKQLLKTIPDTIKVIILSYLSDNIRLNLLKEKHSIKTLTEILLGLPKSIKIYYKLHHCVTLVEPILAEMYKIKMTDFWYTNVFDNYVDNFAFIFRSDYYIDKYYIQCFENQKYKDEIRFFSNRYINIIVYILKIYTKMYRENRPEWHKMNERIILKLMLNILIITK